MQLASSATTQSVDLSTVPLGWSTRRRLANEHIGVLRTRRRWRTAIDEALGCKRCADTFVDRLDHLEDALSIPDPRDYSVGRTNRR